MPLPIDLAVSGPWQFRWQFHSFKNFQKKISKKNFKKYFEKNIIIYSVLAVSGYF